MQVGDRLLRGLFISIWMFAILHVLAQHYYLYWQLRWLDMPMHFLGGVWVGFAVIWLWRYSGFFTPKNGAKGSSYRVVLVGGLLIGLFWELCDYLVWMVGVGALPPHYYLDTGVDLLMDILGVHVAYFIFTFWENRIRGVSCVVER